MGWWWRIAESYLGPAEVRLKFFSLVCRDINTVEMQRVAYAQIVSGSSDAVVIGGGGREGDPPL